VILFPQLRKICDRYLTEKVKVVEPAAILDVFLSPYYGWVIEKLAQENNIPLDIFQNV